MKYHRAPAECAPAAASPPSRGAWIEIQAAQQIFRHRQRRPPRGGRGLESLLLERTVLPAASPPSRGAWIEIKSGLPDRAMRATVAPLAGGVD